MKKIKQLNLLINFQELWKDYILEICPTKLTGILLLAITPLPLYMVFTIDYSITFTNERIMIITLIILQAALNVLLLVHINKMKSKGERDYHFEIINKIKSDFDSMNFSKVALEQTYSDHIKSVLSEDEIKTLRMIDAKNFVGPEFLAKENYKTKTEIVSEAIRRLEIKWGLVKPNKNINRTA